MDPLEHNDWSPIIVPIRTLFTAFGDKINFFDIKFRVRYSKVIVLEKSFLATFNFLSFYLPSTRWKQTFTFTYIVDQRLYWQLSDLLDVAREL